GLSVRDSYLIKALFAFFRPTQRSPFMPVRRFLPNQRAMTTFIVLLVIAALSAAQSNPALEPIGAIRTARVPAPRDVIGFTPGDDRKLASWSQIVDYFKRL